MTWWQISLVAGLFAPLILNTTALRITLEERGIAMAVAVWFGQIFFTVPLMLLIGWLGSLFLN